MWAFSAPNLVSKNSGVVVNNHYFIRVNLTVPGYNNGNQFTQIGKVIFNIAYWKSPASSSEVSSTANVEFLMCRTCGGSLIYPANDIETWGFASGTTWDGFSLYPGTAFVQICNSGNGLTVPARVQHANISAAQPAGKFILSKVFGRITILVKF